ncbi:hypothetical protein, partial [Mycolicibacter heraklionensis]|uniref:hypothetical protein n=1 Tax=Mycolicibacter heraklionensis TaxID=512402 RepID=UPI001A95C77B
ALSLPSTIEPYSLTMVTESSTPSSAVGEVRPPAAEAAGLRVAAEVRPPAAGVVRLQVVGAHRRRPEGAVRRCFPARH